MIIQKLFLSTQQGMGRIGICLLCLSLLFVSCGGKQTLANVAEEDSLCIDTVATLDDEMQPDTIAESDSLLVDSLF